MNGDGRPRRYTARWRRAALRLVLTAVLTLGTTLTLSSLGSGEASAQEPAPMLKLDLVVPADVTADEGELRGTNLCVYLPEEASTVSLSRRPLVPEAGGDRLLWMTIRPYVTTAHPLVERANVGASMTLTIPELGHETCFRFENQVFPREAQVAQPYKYFAQIVTIEVR